MAEPMFIIAKPRKRAHRWLQFFAALVMVLMVLIVVAFLFLTNPAFIHDVVLPRLGKAINANVTVSSISFDPFKQIVLHDLKVQAIGQAPVFTAPEVSVRYHLWDILRGKLHVDEIALNSPTIELVENPDGSRNVDPLLKALQKKPAEAPPPKPKPFKPPQVDLGKLTLRNARIMEIRNFGDGQSNVLELTNLDFTLSNVKNGQSGALQLSAALWVNNNPPNGTNGFVAAAFNGNFNFALTHGFESRLGLRHGRNSAFPARTAYFRIFPRLAPDWTAMRRPRISNNWICIFRGAGGSLGELSISGPLDLTKMEGRLQVALQRR